MSLKDKLAEDLKNSMKNKDVVRKNTVQLVRSGILQFEKDNKVVLDDDGIIDVIAKELKQRRDSLPEFEKSGREPKDTRIDISLPASKTRHTPAQGVNPGQSMAIDAN